MKYVRIQSTDSPHRRSIMLIAGSQDWCTASEMALAIASSASSDPVFTFSKKSRRFSVFFLYLFFVSLT